MFNISSYLTRISGALDKNVFDVQGISSVIEKHTTISRDVSFFDIKDGVLRTNLSPAEKMMLFMKKDALLLDLAPFHVKDIR